MYNITAWTQNFETFECIYLCCFLSSVLTYAAFLWVSLTLLLSKKEGKAHSAGGLRRFPHTCLLRESRRPLPCRTWQHACARQVDCALGSVRYKCHRVLWDIKQTRHQPCHEKKQVHQKATTELSQDQKGWNVILQRKILPMACHLSAGWQFISDWPTCNRSIYRTW